MLQNKILGFAAILLLAGFGSNSIWAKSADRVYWIAADEVQWDYAPSFPINPMTGDEFNADQRIFVEHGIGRRYLKSVYRQYTEGFGAIKPHSAEEEHLGILGPVIRAVVGDRIIVRSLQKQYALPGKHASAWRSIYPGA